MRRKRATLRREIFFCTDDRAGDAPVRIGEGGLRRTGSAKVALDRDADGSRLMRRAVSRPGGGTWGFPPSKVLIGAVKADLRYRWGAELSKIDKSEHFWGDFREISAFY